MDITFTKLIFAFIRGIVPNMLLLFFLKEEQESSYTLFRRRKN